MGMPPAPAAPSAPPIRGTLSPPPASANQAQSAAYKLGEILKHIIHAVPSAFNSETSVLEAVRAIDGFVNSMVPSSARRALAEVPARAPVEDVTKRQPPAGVHYSIPQSMSIDYKALARAMVEVQQEMESNQPPQAPPAPELEQENPSGYGPGSV